MEQASFTGLLLALIFVHFLSRGFDQSSEVQ